MRRRPVALALVLLLAATLLSACRTNVGTAARVGGVRISENDVNDQVLPGGPSVSPSASSTSATTQVSPKSLVLETLVEERLIERTLAANGGVPSAGALGAYDDCANAVFLDGFGSGRTLSASLQRIGVKESFGALVVRNARLECALAIREKVSRFGGTAGTIAQIISSALAGAGVNADTTVVAAVARGMETELATAKYEPLTDLVPSALTATLTKLQVSADSSILQTLATALVSGLRNAQFSGVSSAIRAAKVSVSVSPRYGTWDAATLQFRTDGALPSYLTIRSAGATASASSAP